ncbi:DUF3027 domain-containing protein [Tomitella fengzijianii]|uniref:DUF3027 domain-containing protein n=2 Tax=Tomitella fengzijianii TaxID=2597660 RepID=A0A516X1L0_9ACTN|nr:DUF3027 domain-containing protein [Tomitella fengzijianii]
MGAVNPVDFPTAGEHDVMASAGAAERGSADVPPVLADAVGLARAAVVDLGEGRVGAHLATVGEDDSSASHYFAADIQGYRGWQWVVVVAAAPGSEEATVSEIALLPGVDALVAPQWTPWEERVRPGDLGPGDLLPPPADDPRLVPGYVANGDPEIDDVAWEVGLGRRQVMSREGRDLAAQRWHDGDHGPGSGMAKAAPGTCGGCGFYLPLAGALHGEFGVCGNEFAADGTVVHVGYGCGAHSDTSLPTGAGSPAYEPYDDGALESVAVRSPEPGDAAGGDQDGSPTGTSGD